MTTRQANPLKSLKIIKNHARYQEISKVSTEKGQVVYGDQWEIDQSTLKLTSHPKIFVSFSADKKQNPTDRRLKLTIQAMA